MDILFTILMILFLGICLVLSIYLLIPKKFTKPEKRAKEVRNFKICGIAFIASLVASIYFMYEDDKRHQTRNNIQHVKREAPQISINKDKEVKNANNYGNRSDIEKRKEIYDNINSFTKYYVIKPKINVRKKPISGDVVHQIKRSSTLKLIRKDGDWGYFKYVYSDKPEEKGFGLGKVYEGWIHLNLVESLEDRILAEEKGLGRKVVRATDLVPLEEKVAKNKKKYDQTEILTACRNLIRKKSKFPDKVDFPFLDGYVVLEKGWGYIIHGEAEMMNGLGLIIPAEYKCTFDLRENAFTRAEIL